MLKLYFAPRTRAFRVRWLLEELSLPHELHTLFERNADRFPEFIESYRARDRCSRRSLRKRFALPERTRAAPGIQGRADPSANQPVSA